MSEQELNAMMADVRNRIDRPKDFNPASADGVLRLIAEEMVRLEERMEALRRLAVELPENSSAACYGLMYRGLLAER